MFRCVPGTGYLNFESFCKVAANFLENEDDEVLQKELKEAFRLYDKQGECPPGRQTWCSLISLGTGNGYIPTSSLREILVALDDQLTNDQLNEMIAEIDTDASGTVDFDGNPPKPKKKNCTDKSFSEFIEMMTGD